MLLKQVEQAAAERPESVALTFSGQSHSYAAVKEAADKLRGSLAALGIGKGDCVAILLPNCPHFIIAHLAVLGLGAISVPVHVQQKAREIGAQFEDCELRAFIAWGNRTNETEKAVQCAESLRARIYLGDAIPAGSESLLDLIAHGESLSPDESVTESDLAALVYTSGTSGHPRGVELTHANFAAHASLVGHQLRIRPSDSFACTLPFSGICGLTMGVHLPLYFGAATTVHSRFHPGDTLSGLHESKSTVLVANPAAYALMAGFPSPEKYDLGQLRYAISCESSLPDQVARDVEDNLKFRVFEAYGNTESCGVVTLNLFPPLAERGSVGQPIEGHEIAVLDPQGSPLAAGKCGRIAVRGPAVMRGYRSRPDKTRQVIQDGWLITGDEGYLDEQSNLFVTVQDAEVIRKGGFPVYCREVEEVVEGLPHVQDVAVIGISDPVLGEEIKACVVLKEGAVIGPGEIVQYAKERLAPYKCPKIVKFYKELPRTPTGKIIRSVLKEDRA